METATIPNPDAPVKVISNKLNDEQVTEIFKEKQAKAEQKAQAAPLPKIEKTDPPQETAEPKQKLRQRR